MADPAANFRRFWYSRVLSQTAQAALLYGMFILLVDQTRSGLWLSLFVITSILPSVLFGLPGGVVADWAPQRFLLIVLNLARAGAIYPLIRGDASLTRIFIVATLIWTIHQFYSPAESAMLPRLVDAEALPRAASRHNLALSLAQLLGMVLLAPLTLKLGITHVLLIACGLLYLSAGAMLVFVAVPRSRVDTAVEPVFTAARGSLRAGWRAAVRDGRAFAALIDSVLIAIGLSALVVIVPQYLEQVLGTGADNTVFVFAPAALGVVVGLQVAPLVGQVTGFGRLATAGLLLFALTIFAIGMIDQVADTLAGRGIIVSWLDRQLGLPPRISATMLLSIPAGFAIGLVNVAARTVLARRTRAESHARVYATQMTIANLGALAPTLAAGLLIDLTGVRAVAIVIALSLVIGAILGRRIGGGERRSLAGRATP